MSLHEAPMTDKLTMSLSQLDSRLRWLCAAQGLGIACLVLVLGAVVAVVLDGVLHLGSGSRTILLVLLVASVFVVAWRRILLPLLRTVDPSELAAVVEETHPSLNERLVSTIELNDPKIPERHKGSSLMRELLTRQTMTQTASIDFGSTIPSETCLRPLSLALCLVCLLIFPMLFAPSTSRLLVSRLFLPWENHETWGLLQFDIVPRDVTVPRGTDVAVTAKVQLRTGFGLLPQTLWLRCRGENRRVDERRMEFDEQNNVYAATMSHVLRPFDYHVASGTERSRDYRVHVADPPEIDAATLEIIPPGYTGLPAQIVDGVLGDIPVFERSEMSFRLQLSQPVASAEFVWQNPDTPDSAVTPMLLSPDGRSASLEMTANMGGPFEFRLRGEDGLYNPPEPPRRLRLIPDRPPTLELSGEGSEQQATVNDVLAVVASADDDLGLAALELHYKVFQKKAFTSEVPGERLGRRSVEHAFSIRLADLDLAVGDVVTYRVRAADTRPIPGPNEVWSDERTVMIQEDAPPPGTNQLTARQRELREELQTIIDGVVQNKNGVQELQQEAEAGSPDESGSDKNSAIPPRIQEQRQLAEQLEQLARRFAEHPLYANLVPDSQEAAREHLPQAQQKLQEAAKAPVNEKVKPLNEAVESLAKVESKLRQVESEFDQLAEMERDLLELNRLAQRTQALADDVSELDQQRTEEPSSRDSDDAEQHRAELDRTQQQLQQEQRDLSDDLNDLLDRRPELIEAAKRNQLDQLGQLAERAAQIAEPQELLAEALREAADQSSDRMPSQTQQSPQPSQMTADAKTQNSPQAEETQNTGRNQSSQPSENEEREGQQTAESPRESGPRPDSDAPAAAAETEETNEPPSRAEEVMARQAELNRDAAKLALDIASQTGSESAATREAMETVRQNERSTRQTQAGQFSQASQSAQSGAQSAQQAAQELGRSPERSPRLQEQAEQLAQRQEQMAGELQQLAQSPAEQHQVQEHQQEQLSEAARTLSERLEQVAQNLDSAPLNMGREAEQARNAQQSAEQGRGAMQQASRELQQNNPHDAAQSADEAAHAMRQAAQRAGQATSQASSPSPSPIPPEVGGQISQAVRQLQQAGQQLAQAGREMRQRSQNRTDSSSSQMSETPAEATTENSQSSQASQSGQQTSQGNSSQSQSYSSANAPSQSANSQQEGSESPSLTQSAESLRQAADSLNQASAQLQLAPGQSGPTTDSQDQNPDSSLGGKPDGNEGNGAQATVDLRQLENRLQKMTKRNWGELPGHLRTEILQAAQRRPNGDYAKLIKLYFEEIAKTRTSESTP